ncbi:MAG: hypothetical protein KZQ83_12770 [gamma proteobacterium symbiont of Taylorina sp.]|nr:hypothetical protein [gamma proteobacterium symbiont of Taylorina sp.]
MNNSSLLQGNLLSSFQKYYAKRDRKIIQYLPQCAVYDQSLSYTLKPGNCHIKNREFDINYAINKIGLRDDGVSLLAPEVIVVGDSHAMGWGVSRDSGFSHLVERKSNKSVLNAAISSYGTVREMKMLERINTSNMKYLIIQYCDNDFYENTAFSENNDKLNVMSQQKYNAIQEKHLKKIDYYFGKHTRNLISMLRKGIKAEFFEDKEKTTINPADESANEVSVFLNAIAKPSVDLSDVELIIVEINGYNKNDNLFINALKKRIENHSTGISAKKISTIDLSLILKQNNYFNLDEHMNPSGHEQVSKAIMALLNN